MNPRRKLLVACSCACLGLAGGFSRPCPAQENQTKQPAAEDAIQQSTSRPLEWLRVSSDGSHFVGEKSGKRFVVWGVNYDHDNDGKLLEDYWHDQWSVVEEDFQEIKDLGANTVRVHLQVAKFMDTAERANRKNLDQLARLVRLAERTGLYLDVTGLGCYHKQDTPKWYDALEESARWGVQLRFWRSVAKVCKDSPAVFCYDLMNEPILPGKNKPETDWLAGEFAGKHFVQRISLDLDGRTRKEVARDWVAKLSAAIRKIDDRHMITVGVIPWAHSFPGAKPLFYAPEVAGPLDFVSVHFYPKPDYKSSLAALKVYEIGKPLVVEEIFPLKSGLDKTAAFIDESREYTDGWISFYWGRTIQQCERQGDLQGTIIAKWLRYFRSQSPGARAKDEAK